MSRKSQTIVGMVMCALPLMWAVHAEAAPPRHAASTVTRTGPAGHSILRNSNLTTNGLRGYTAGSTLTGPAGHKASRQQSGSYDPATQTYSRSGTTTGPAGNSTGFSTSAQKTPDGYQRSGVRTGPEGNAVTTNGTGSRDPAAGTATQSRSIKGPKGNGPTESRTITASPTTTVAPSN